MRIRKIWPTVDSGAWLMDPRTQPVPSMAAWVVGSASAANTIAAGAGKARVALTVSVFMASRLLAMSFEG
jgi:hypothetical protein